VWGGESKLFSSKVRQYHSPDGADGTSNESLTCPELVFMSNWSNFGHAFASRWFVKFFVYNTLLNIFISFLSSAQTNIELACL